ncbi:hypothetical protein GQ54DRAFT_320354 [Martensiomyces pterosporus]|nr:hypothetical protein GQ54DRAFT_320354 [Martensiomyces pterosporus]
MDSTLILHVKHRLVTFGIHVDPNHLSLGEALVKSFLGTNPDGDFKTPIEVQADFIRHCVPRNPDIALAAFAAFNNSFCTRNNIHVVVQEHSLDANQVKGVLRGYFSAWNIASGSSAVPSSPPALFSDPSVSIMAIFGGQGGMDNYLDEARDLVDIYGPLLADYPAKMSAFLQHESQDPRISRCYTKGLDVARWLASPESQPDPEYLLTVPVSIPAVGLIQLMQVMIAFKTLGLSPGELAKSFKVATGHSQGIAIATALSQVTDEQSFYAISEKILGLLMLTGVVPQVEYPLIHLNPKVTESVSELDGPLYPMVSVQGVSRQVLESFIAEFNTCQRDKDLHVFLSLVNTYDQFIVSGELEAVVQFVKLARSKSAPLDEDQSHIPFSQRKPKADLFKTQLSDVTSAPNWLARHGPRLVRTAHDDQIHIDSPMHHILGKPPVMVAGMTPTTSNESFVAAINAAGKAEIIERISRDHFRPWFGKKSDGRVVDIEEMTYAEVAHRLVETMYVRHQSRWIHPSYRNLVFDFLQRIEHRLNKDAALYFVQACAYLDIAPFEFVSTVVSAYSASQTQLVGSEDVQYFISLCQRGNQKPVPFIPRMDASFYAWFMKDAVWQSEDLDTIIDQDVQRVLIQQGPVAARYSTKVNEPVKHILDGIYHGQVAALLERYYGGDTSKVPTVEYLGVEPVVSTLPPSVITADSSSERVYYLPTDEALLPDHDTWISTICGPRKSWLHALLTAPLIFQGSRVEDNYVRRMMRPRTGQIVTIYEDDRGSVQSLGVTRSSGNKDIDISIDDRGVIVLTIYQPSVTTTHALGLRFAYNPSQPASPIHEVMSGRDDHIRQFYTLFGKGNSKRLLNAATFPMPGDAIEVKDIIVTKEWVSKYCSVIGNRSANYPPNSKKATLAPMDMLAIISIDNLSKSMTSEYVHNGLLSLVHLFSHTRYADGASLLKICDTVSCKSVISELANTDAGKRIVVDIQIFREDAQIAMVQSSLLWRGVFIKEDIAYKHDTEPLSRVVLKSIEDIKALESREWFIYREGSEGALQPASVIEFHLESRYRYSSKDIYSSIKTTGSVLLSSSTHEAAHIADVSFECGSSFGNPVTEYLACHGQPAESTAMFEGGGYEIVPKSSSNHMVAIVPDTNWPYSHVSGDYNPIHTNCYVADIAGLPGTITHGLWTSASTRSLIEMLAANDQPERVRSYQVSFQGMVFPKDRLEAKVFHVGMKDGRMLVKGQTFQAGGELVLDSIAEIEQETTAYVFTGQGSQEVGMGMDLYESSPAARAVWDRAEQHMLKVYGVSLLKVVRTNPTQLTVFFGGKLGAQIRSNYMALSKHRNNKAARLFPGIAEATGSFTFKSPSGLLNATQFTQPALVVLELAAVADLRSRSLLAPGVEPFREYLLSKIDPSSVDYSTLHNRYIPNLTGLPFEVSRDYFKLVHDLTESPAIGKHLQKWDDNLLDSPVEVAKLGHTLLVELLAYQFASPVRWIETQSHLFNEMRIERFVEIGPSATLCGMAERTRRLLESPTMHAASILHVVRDRADVYYEYESTPSSDAEQEQEPEPAGGSQAAPALPAPQQSSLPPPSAAAPSNLPGAAIADTPLEAVDVIHTIVAHKLKRALDMVPVDRSIKELTGGKSTLQNEILGDLQKEISGTMPDKPEELPLRELAAAVGSFSGTLGKHTSSHIARLFSAKMPGGFTQSAARSLLQTAYGLGPQRQDALLLAALTMEPASRLPSEAEAKAWLDSVSQAYAKSSGIAYTAASASGGGGSVGGAVFNSAEFDKAQREQREHVLQQMQVLARYAGVDLREGARSSESTSAEKQGLQSKLDRIEAEFGADLVEGTKTLFDTRKARRYNSSWNWARQEAVEWVYSVLAGREQPSHDQASDSARLHALANRSTPALLSLVAATISAMEKSSGELPRQAVSVAKRIYAACKEALDSAPVYKEFSSPMRPVTRISFKGVVEYSETPRENEPSFVEYVQHMQSEAGAGDPPLLHLKEKAKRGGAWTYSVELSRVYFGALEQMSTTGLSFAGKTALVTGCGRGSIGADILRGLLAGGARVVATTSSYSHKTTLFYEEMYREHGGRGSELIVVPFNQGSAADITALVEYIYSDGSGSKGLGWDLDFVIPFAAISEVGIDITGINSRSELAHRVMLTNILRLLGEIKEAKDRLGYVTHPSLVILPLSPNHGDFGGDGLYGESKAGLETIFNRWKSESWAGYLSIAGAAIGWTRGTGLMSSNDAVAHEMEKLGARTFSTREMAFNILGLLHPTIGALAKTKPVWADLSCGFQLVSQLDEAAANARSSLLTSSSIKKAAFVQSANDYDVVTRGGALRIYLGDTHEPLANHKYQLPVIKSYEQLEHLHHLQGMVNLDKVVVVTGYGEVGPFGNAEHRWEMEAFGEFSLEGCIELAWIMGLIKHHNGPLKSTGTVYTGWVDAKSGEPVKDRHIKAHYEDYILEHTGIRLIEPEMMDGYDPNKKPFIRELQIEHDMEPFEASADEAAAFKHQNGDRVDVWENKDGSWSVRFLKGAVIHAPKALRFDRLVSVHPPTGWDPARYGIPDDIVRQVDIVTCYTLIATVEALVRSGITDPYELYCYFHVSEVGNTIGSSIGGGRKVQGVFKKRFLDSEVQSDVLQETFINTTAAWINMLLMSSSGPIKPTVGACGTSVLSIEVAVETIQTGKAKVMLAGGFEAFTEESSYEFAQMGATSNSLEEFASGRTPKEMCRPCTSTRNGFVEGEGAGVVTLMSASAAIEFGAPIYGIVAMSGTASDKQGSSVPAPGQGVLTSAREMESVNSEPLLDLSYRRRRLDRQLAAIDEWMKEELGDLECGVRLGTREAIIRDANRERLQALDTWSNEFWKRNPQISPLRGSLAVWGLTVDDIGVASFHGTSTVANDKNESEVLNRQMEHLGRTPGLAVPAVCQKWLTGHPKGPAAAWMLDGVLQSLRTGIIPGNRNADNIDPEFEKFEYIVYPSRSIQTPGIKAGLLKSFGFGQVGGEILVVHPDYLLAVLTREQLDEYNEKLRQREAKSYRYWQDTLVGNHPFVQVKSAPPYTLKQEQQVYLDPLARAKHDSAAKRYKF